MKAFGKLVHFSIPATDVQNSVEFYEKLLGWKFKKMTDTYWLTEDGVGSISLEKEPVSNTMPILYFAVEKIEDSLKQAVDLGAKIILDKTDSGDGNSCFATIQDINANTIGLWAKTTS